MTDLTTALLLALIPSLLFLLWGYSVWRKKERLVGGIVGPQIKLPACMDVSHWKEIPDFTLVTPRPALFITKATEGLYLTDVKFERFFRGMASIGVQRGAYHFFRKDVSAIKQAQHFADVVGPHITAKDFLILDVEEGGEKATQLWVWFELVRQKFPANRVMLYGRKNLLDPIPMTEGEREYFKKIPVWAAGYPWFPDLFNSVPFWYVPDQTKWGQVWLWQYSESGAVTGIQGAVDLNWIAPEFQKVLFDDDVTPIPPNEEETIMTTYKLTALTDRNIRSGAGTTYPITLSLGVKAGDIVESDAHAPLPDGSDWYRITKLLHNDLSVALPSVNSWASAGVNGSAMRLDETIEPPAPAAAGRVKVTINAEITDASGKVYSKVIMVDEPLETLE